MENKIDLVVEYDTVLAKYRKLCDFLKRVEDGSSPIHDDYPVSELYEQQKEMSDYIAELKARLDALGVEV